jgi:thiamine pyrophosphokinase
VAGGSVLGVHAVIVANGKLGLAPARLRRALAEADLVVGADGGAAAVLAAGSRPDAVVGDFDSLAPRDHTALAAAGAQVVRHPRDKDQTDLELALLLAAQRGATKVTILGALGGPRLDHALGNVLLLAMPELAGREVTLLDGTHEVFLLAGPARRAIAGRPGDLVSLMPLAGDAAGITTSGLRYALDRGSLAFGRSRGISNQLTGRQGSISLDHGRLLVTIHHLTRRSPGARSVNTASG